MFVKKLNDKRFITKEEMKKLITSTELMILSQIKEFHNEE